MQPSRTPRTDAVEFYAGDLDGGQEAVPADFARELERELNAVRICVGVASKERGEWAAEREGLVNQLNTAEAKLNYLRSCRAGEMGERLFEMEKVITENERLRSELLEKAALECDREADRQSLYASEAGTPGLRLIHGTAANTLMSVAHRIRALKGGMNHEQRI